MICVSCILEIIIGLLVLKLTCHSNHFEDENKLNQLSERP